jgi:predicted nucleic acid-binding protein
MQQARDWLASEPAWVPQATARQARLLGELLTVPGLRANDVPDAYLAALAIDHGLILCSADAGFARFPRLRWRNPLVD